MAEAPAVAMSDGAAAANDAPAATPSFREALRFWCKLGFISFGGPAGQIAIMHRELVEQRRWISEERFLHALNFCMLLPGPEAQQLATYIGWLQHGIRGGVAAGALFVLPGFLLITAISILYASLHSLPAVQGLLFGLKSAVLAVVIEAVLRIGKRALKRNVSWWIACGAFVAIFAFGVPFPAIILAAAALGYFTRRWQPPGATARSATESPARPASHASALRIACVCVALWFAPLVLLAVTLGATHVLTTEGVYFSKLAVVTFGGAYAVLAYVAQEAVGRYGWLGPDDMLQGLALAETTPGPLILVLTFVGAVAAFRDAAPFDPVWAAVLGATLTTWVTFVPCFLWILVGAPYIERLRHLEALSAALAGVTAAVVGVILNLAIWFALHALFHDVDTWRGYGLTLPVPALRSVDVPAATIAVLALIALFRLKVPMLWVLAMCAAAGLGLELVR